MNSNVPPPPGYDASQDDATHEYENDDLQVNAPKVGAAPGRIFVVLAIFLIILSSIAYILFSEKEKPKVVAEEKERSISKESAQSLLPPPPPPAPLPTMRPMMAAPDLPRLETSPAGTPPSLGATANAGQVTPPPLPLPAAPKAKANEESKKSRAQRLKSGMVVFSGGVGSAMSSAMSAEEQEKKKSMDAMAAGDQNLGFSKNVVATSSAAKVTAGRIKNLSSTIAQGKLIHAVLETAINTQLPSQLRAVISHDIYAEAGKARLIPKGSRLIGVYNTALFNGQDRVYIVWTRIIRPDGIDIMVNSEAVDALGRGGIRGNLDSRYAETFASAVLTSVFGIGVAAATEAALDTGSSTSTTSSQGDTTTTASPTATAATQATDNINQTATSIIQNMIDTRPVITIDQGTPVNVMVNKDLIFPTGLSNNFGSVE